MISDKPGFIYIKWLLKYEISEVIKDNFGFVRQTAFTKYNFSDLSSF